MPNTWVGGIGCRQGLQAHSVVKSRLEERSYLVPGDVASQKLQLLHPFAQGDPLQLLAGAACHLPPPPPPQPWYMLHPGGLARQLWDTCAVLLICGLVLLIPVQICFYEEEDACEYFTGSATGNPERLGRPWPAGALAFSSSTNAFFIFDILINFLTGVYTVQGDQKVVDFHWAAIMYNYFNLKTHPNFYIDATACLPLNCILVSAGRSSYNAGQLIRLLRVVTIGRRLHGSPFRWLDRISDLRQLAPVQEFSHNLRRLIAMASFLFCLMHYLACLLWVTLRAQGFPDGTWPHMLGLEDHAVAEQWLWSFFAVTSAMIGLGYASYPPQTWPEAFVYVIIMLASNITYAFLNGLIISMVLSAATGRQEFKDFMDKALAVLKARKVPKPLRQQVMHYLKHKHSSHRIVRDADILGDLPMAIQTQLACVTVGHVLSRMPLFASNTALLEAVAPFVFRTVAIEGQILQQQGHGVETLYFVGSGFVDLLMDGRLVDTLGEGACFGEVSLLRVPESQVGELPTEDTAGSRFKSPVTAVALSNCELYALRASDFEQAAAADHEVQEQLAKAASRHCQRLHKFREVQLRPSVHSGSTASIRTQQSHNTTYGLGPSFTTPVEGANVLPCALLQSLARCSVSGLGAAPWPATEAATGVQGFQGHFCKSKAAGSSASSGGQATGDVIAAGRAGAGTVSEGLEGMEGGSLG